MVRLVTLRFLLRRGKGETRRS